MKKYLLIAALSLSACAKHHLTLEERLNRPETAKEQAARLELISDDVYDALHSGE